MTVDEATAIEEAVFHCDGLPVSAVHWQLDANFWGDHAARDFARWVREDYNPGIRRLVDAWVARMEAGEVAPVVPVPGYDLGPPPRRALRPPVWVGYANYTIQTDGTIIPCPIMTGMTGFYLGHIRDADPLAIPAVPVGGCGDCGIASFCGGRCLYAAITEPWPATGRAEVCGTVRNLHDALISALPRVRTLLEEGTIEPADFVHVKFNGCEIIP